MNSNHPKFFPLNIKNILVFFTIWLLVGFPFGTCTLMGPVRWITEFTRNSSLDPSIENWLIRIVILLFIASSFFVSLYLVKGFVNTFSQLKKVMIIGLPICLSVLALWLWFNPSIMQFNSTVSSESYDNIEFIFGPYPDEDKIIELKKQNITGIISLLHEAVVPFEPKFLSDEIEQTAKYGLKLIHLPMLPWVSSNEHSLNEIRRIAREGSGKYYVHCYLGKDRVGVVRRVIKDILGEENISGEYNQRNIENKKSFERGRIIKLDDRVYLTPYPTDEEFFAYILNGAFENVVSLLTQNNPEDVQWIEKEEQLLRSNNINYHYMPIDIKSYDLSKINEYTQKIKHMEKPILIHAFLVDSPQTDLFMDSYKDTNQ
jgi:protein tyrosine phosphatase (PTP) superfamily phosphohydrolase (DUF442 family)